MLKSKLPSITHPSMGVPSATAPSTGFSSVEGAIAKPFSGTTLSTARKGHVTRRIDAAMSAVRGAGDRPPGLSVPECKLTLDPWFLANDLIPPSVRTYQRYFWR